MDEEEPRLRAPLRPEQQRRLRDFGLELELTQIPAKTGDKTSGRTVLPTTDSQEDIMNETQTQTTTPQSQPTAADNLEQSFRAMAADTHAMRKEFARASSWQADAIRAGAITVAVFAGATTALLTANAIINRGKPELPAKK